MDHPECSREQTFWEDRYCLVKFCHSEFSFHVYILHTPVGSFFPVQNVSWGWGPLSNTVEGEAAVSAGRVPKALKMTNWRCSPGSELRLAAGAGYVR